MEEGFSKERNRHLTLHPYGRHEFIARIAVFIFRDEPRYSCERDLVNSSNASVISLWIKCALQSVFVLGNEPL